MDWQMWATTLASGVLGAGIALAGTWVSARKRERAEVGAEWGRRFAAALGEISQAGDERRRLTGQAILESLVDDDRGTPADRMLARDVLAREMRDRERTGGRPTVSGEDTADVDADGVNAGGVNAGGVDRARQIGDTGHTGGVEGGVR